MGSIRSRALIKSSSPGGAGTTPTGPTSRTSFFGSPADASAPGPVALAAYSTPRDRRSTG